MVNNDGPRSDMTMQKNPYVLKFAHLPWPPPKNGEEHVASRFIGTTPLWDLNLLKSIAQECLDSDSETLIYAVTEDCNKDMAKENITVSHIAHFILQLTNVHYKDTTWCFTGKRPGVKVDPDKLWLPCDAYALTVEHDAGYGKYPMNLYLKMCSKVSENIVVTVSVHS